MAQLVYRGNLSAAKFPFLARLQGRTIIVPQYDNVYVPVVASKADDDKDRGIPQIYYCHNVLPTDQGFQAIGFKQLIASTGTNSFDSIQEIRSGVNRALFSHKADGTNWICNGAVWTKITVPAILGGVDLVTLAYVDGETYIYFQGIGCFTYNFATKQLVSTPLTALSVATTIGITAASGYLIAWSLNAVAWSSTVDPTDFTPSLITGAGGGGVQGARGNITVCTPHALGFVAYTENNAVAAVYSGNARFPFNFKEISGSGGCSSLKLITSSSNASNQYAYTSSGLQNITLLSATTIFPELTDFLSGKLFEDFDEITLAFVETPLRVVMMKRVSLVSDRYLVFSYGIISFTHALVYDFVLRRWGKIKRDHVDCFEWILNPPEILETPKESLAFLSYDGTIATINFSQTDPSFKGVLVLGKYQYIRQRMLQLQKAEIENVVHNDVAFKFYTMYSLDGKNTNNELGYLANNVGLAREYLFSSVGINHSLLWLGAFHAVSYVLHFNTHGKA